MTHETRRVDRRDFLRSASSAVMAAAVLPREATNLIAQLSPALPTSIAQARPFELLVLGDSIMWGQGLKEHQKFSFQVAQWLGDKLPGVAVHRHVFAHSGARIERDDVEDAKQPTHGEVPNNFPSIFAQLDAARSATFSHPKHAGAPAISVHPTTNAASVALVLVDGGINDFGTKTILTLDPSKDGEWVRETTRDVCVARMNALLPEVAAAFPNAKIVITNYFQIVSKRSNMVYVWELLRMWNIVGGAINWGSEDLRAKLSEQSLAFHEESTAGFRKAVRDVTSQVVATAKPVPVGSVATSVESILQRPSRVALAEIPFGPDHAYGAPETLLFYVNEPDPAASVRKPKCVDQVPNASLELPNCLLAATGHPNVNGAKVYASAITNVLERWIPEWQSAFAPSPTTSGREGVRRGVRRP